MRAIAFDIYGTYAHFKAWYMTTSRTTYPLPPRTALAGIIGAIMGIEREDLPTWCAVGNGIRFGVRSLKPIKMRILVVKGLRGPAVLSLTGKKGGKRVEVNWLKDNSPPRIPLEVIDQPEYRAYVHFPQDSDLNKLSERIQGSRPHFRPYLGTANMIAYFREKVLNFDIKTTGPGTGKLAGLVPKETAQLDVQELRRNNVRLTEVVAQSAVTESFAFHHGEFLMDMGAIGIPGRLAMDFNHVIDDGLTIPLI
ncbi:CRISPR-associated protein Cas5 [Candidatus Manganitrophus noduliformans]|uniref:CRISPR-associated protein Cas5 n=1 Tax=Candidatus Manganitrophus noduliformans TaxID=2606439 RepID=A0A7X6DUP8_9BACT|nr:CRISPR-associated protein Cas5 [Candidatus Manganitrophus noduliformans]NKE73665.1 CRISPR-associated protein Cas5 [Candidatus Manganitrophus noduliformans]